MAETETAAEASTLTTEELIRFFSVLSHDLKSPIFSIDGFSDLLLADYADKLDEDGRDFLQRIRSSAQQMKRVLDEMSHMIKLLGRASTPAPTDVRELFDEVCLKHNYLVEEGGVTLNVADSLPTITVDRDKLREILGALLSNALTFTDRPKNDRHVSLEYRREGDLHLFDMIDNGIGIDPRYSEQVFELGGKLDKSRGPGAGYGLFLARRLAESQGGTLTVTPNSGGGSRFTLALPG